MRQRRSGCARNQPRRRLPVAEETVEEYLARGGMITRRRLTLKSPPPDLPPPLTPDLPERPRPTRNGHADRQRAQFRKAVTDVETAVRPGFVDTSERRAVAAGTAGIDYPLDALFLFGYITSEQLREA